VDETGTIVTFKEDVTAIEMAEEDKKKARQTITTVIIPESITIIPAKAFVGFSLLAAVSLPQALEEIGLEAFKG